MEVFNMVPLESQEKVIIVAKTLWGEARGESSDGLIGVGCVIRNRVFNPAWWGNTYEDVCLKSGQFSCWTEEAEAMKFLDVKKDPQGRECAWVAIGVIYNCLMDLTKGADHYLAKWMLDKGVAPKWAVIHQPVAVIGHHAFYKIGPQG